MYDVISLSVSCRRGISDLNCSECTTSFSCNAMCEVSYVSSQITVQNGPCLFACVLSLRFNIMLSIACSPIYSHITSLSYLLIHLCESYIIMFVHLCASQIYYFIYSYLCSEYPYFVFSMACWRVGELCGHAAHASPTHPGAVACVLALYMFKTPNTFSKPRPHSRGISDLTLSRGNSCSLCTKSFCSVRSLKKHIRSPKQLFGMYCVLLHVSTP